MALAERRVGNAVLINLVLIISVIGALNWGLVGFFNFNLVDALFGGGARETTSGLSRFVYALVGLAGLALLFLAPWQRANTRGSVHIPSGRRSVV
jgi:hypothetical protein